MPLPKSAGRDSQGPRNLDPNHGLEHQEPHKEQGYESGKRARLCESPSELLLNKDKRDTEGNAHNAGHDFARPPAEPTGEHGMCQSDEKGTVDEQVEEGRIATIGRGDVPKRERVEYSGKRIDAHS